MPHASRPCPRPVPCLLCRPHNILHSASFPPPLPYLPCPPTQVNARELEREAYVERSFGELQRLMVEATERLRQLVDAVREHQDGLRMATLEQGAGSGGGAAGVSGAGWGGVSGGGGGDGVSGRLGWGGGEVEALQNLVERLDFTRPAAGSLGAVMAQL